MVGLMLWFFWIAGYEFTKALTTIDAPCSWPAKLGRFLREQHFNRPRAEDLGDEP